MTSRAGAGGWRPILRGDLAKTALEAVDAVGEAVARVRPSPRNPSLSSGSAGLAVFHAYWNRGRGFRKGDVLAERFLEKAEEGVASVTLGPSLFSGFSGVAWAMAHLQGRFSPPDEGKSTEAVDDALIDYLHRPGWRGDYDLISGLVGLGVYALERLPSPAGVACLEGVVDRIEETAVRRPEGIAWHTGPELLPRYQRKENPSGYDNLGLAHGVPGVIALLGAAWAAGIRRRAARRLLDGAVPWLLSRELDSTEGTCFPAWIGDDGRERERGRRSAWCYGDPGVAVALFGAARCVGNLEWEREALRLARRAARLPPEQSGVVDAGLCHGAAGLAHIFNRMFQATGDRILGRAARYWFGRTLAMRRRGRGIGGFSAREILPNGKQIWTDERALFGAGGIALSLLSAATSIEPEWDRMLLVSSRASHAGRRRRGRSKHTAK